MKVKTPYYIGLLIILLLSIVACNTVSVPETQPFADTTSPSHKHHWNEWVTVQDNTCTQAGIQEHNCSCGEKEVMEIPPLGHQEAIDPAVPPTCTEDGMSEGKYCTVCNAVLAEKTIVSAKGHIEVIDAAVAATWSEMGLTEGKHCAVCDTVLVKQETVASSQHIYHGVSCTVCNQTHPNIDKYKGKVISILGDSISTYEGYNPVADGFNVAHRSWFPRYSITSVKYTWWWQLIDKLDAKLGINDSWSGTPVWNNLDNETLYIGKNTSMASLTRILNLGANGTPDVILFEGGTNDLVHKVPMGSFDPDTAPTQPDLTCYKWDSFAQAYTETILRLKHFYPDAQLVCILPAQNNRALGARYTEDELKQCLAIIRLICTHYEVSYVDLIAEGFTMDMLDDFVHPNTTGMDFITDRVAARLLDTCKLQTGENNVYTITHQLKHVTASKCYYHSVSDGSPFEETLSCAEPFSVKILMGGVDITDKVYTQGKIQISAVTGDLIIQASEIIIPKTPENYRWTFNGSDLVSEKTSVYTDNTLTRLSGSVIGGVHHNTRYELEKTIVLYHDRSWSIEWRSTGNWTDTTDGALLFAGSTISKEPDVPYLYRRQNSDFIAIGVYTGGQYHNYGVSLVAHGIDATIEHTYKLENRIEENGTNMVYLLVDGIEIGAMNHHFIAGTDTYQTVNWLNGQDLTFTHMGTTPHTIGGCSISYISIQEDG